MTTTTMGSNGSVRKTLASQLDRLDQILDTLGEGLHEAVASVVSSAVEQAVRQAVHEAVGAVLTEVLTNPDLQAALRTVGPEIPPAPPRPTEKSKGMLGRAWGKIKGGVNRLRATCAVARGRLVALKPAAQLAWGLVCTHKWRLLAACGVGVTLAVGAYWAGPYAVAAAGWVGGFTAALAVQARSALRRALAAVPLT